MSIYSDIIIARFDQLITDANSLQHDNIRAGVHQNLQNMRQAIVDEVTTRASGGQAGDLTADEFTRYSTNCDQLQQMISRMVAQDMRTMAMSNAAMLDAMRYAQNLSWQSYWYNNGYWPFY